MRKVILILTLLLIFVGCMYAQQKKEKKLKAQEILNETKYATSQNLNFQNIKSFSLRYKTTSSYVSSGKNRTDIEDNKLSLMLQNIRLETFGESTTNTSNTILITDGVLFKRESEVFVNGAKLNAAFNFSTPKEEEIKNLQRDTWLVTFPIFFESTIYKDLEITYIGKAESDNKRAYILEAYKDENKYRLFIDEETNLLLMMTRSWKDQDETEHQIKYYFSDYREESGILFAHKIRFESDVPSIGQGETTIKSLVLNPPFKDDVFEID
ncbi:MAG: hypothetical protein ACK5NT_13710 [Pyrinomonadaceae bacterium]